MPLSGVLYDGRSEAALSALLDLPRVEIRDTLPSTQDLAHELAEQGAPAGTLVLADAQTAGRGREARSWQSAAGAGIWMTLVERPRDAVATGVLSLRLALRLAPVLERWTAEPVRIKWPNDLLAGGRKLAGILVEARWRGGRPDWVAIGIGVNLRPPAGVDGAALASGAERTAVLGEMIPAVRAAAAALGPLTEEELAIYRGRDALLGRSCTAPVAGTAAGITADGAIIIRGARGDAVVRSGSLVLEEQP